LLGGPAPGAAAARGLVEGDGRPHALQPAEGSLHREEPDGAPHGAEKLRRLRRNRPGLVQRDVFLLPGTQRLPGSHLSLIRSKKHEVRSKASSTSEVCRYKTFLIT